MIELCVGTFNVAAGKQPDKEILRQWIDEEEIDVLALQEVDEYTKRTPFSMSHELGLNHPYRYFSKAISFESGDYGIALISKFPFEKQGFRFFQSFGTEKRLYQRVLLIIDKKQIAVYHTHLSFESPDIRVNQVKQLLKEVNRETAEYIIILGDFNMDDSLDEWDLFKGYQLVNGYKGEWHNTFVELDEKMKVFTIDNIILSKNISIEEISVKETQLSDHSLLKAKIRLL